MEEKKRSDSIPLLDIIITKASTPQVKLRVVAETSTSTPQVGVIAEVYPTTPQVKLRVVAEASPSTPEVEGEGVIAEVSPSTPQVEGGVIAEVSPSPQVESTLQVEGEGVIAEVSPSTPQVEGEGVIAEVSPSAPQVELEGVITEDGILCSIISSLSVKEAVRTCVLSTKWRCIWTHRSILRFDTSMLDSHTYCTLQDKRLTPEERYELLIRKREQFIESVDSVLQQYRGNRVEGLFVQYYLTKLHSHHLDKWIGFAVASKAKKLTLQLFKPYLDGVEEELYNFPCQLLGSSCAIEQLTLNSCYLKPPCKFDGLSHLRDLNLFCIDISGEDINRLLYNCYTLESLNIWYAPQLVTLCIPQALNQFNYLFIRQCDRLREINISAVNLGKIKYAGPQVDFIFRESSHLKDAIIAFIRVVNPNLDYHLNKLSSSLPHLRSLLFHPCGLSKMSNLPKGSNSFIHLTHLDWVWSASIKMSLQCLATILDFAPFLEEFKLRLWVHLLDCKCYQKQLWMCVIEQPPRSLKKLRRMLPDHPHTHLKKIEIHDFYWDKWQVEIALYILKNASKLEAITLLKGRFCLTEIPEMDIKNLSQEVPSNVKLAISISPAK